MSWKSNQVFLPDLSHYEWPCDLNKLADSGCVGVIWKATQGSGNQDSSYKDARAAAYAAGLLWGAYHFGDGSNGEAQANNFLSYAMPSSDDLICLDFEDNGNNTMSLAQAQAWIEGVESNLSRPNECVLYSGNRIKETLGDKPSEFWGAHRLWVCQYGDKVTIPKAWPNYWLWQFTDGSAGPEPHSAAGCGACDMNAYDYSEDQLKAEWATGVAAPTPPSPPLTQVVTLTIDAPPGVEVNVVQNAPAPSQHRRRRLGS